MFHKPPVKTMTGQEPEHLKITLFENTLFAYFDWEGSGAPENRAKSSANNFVHEHWISNRPVTLQRSMLLLITQAKESINSIP